MLKQFFANAIARKAMVFLAAFAICGVALGAGLIANRYDTVEAEGFKFPKATASSEELLLMGSSIYPELLPLQQGDNPKLSDLVAPVAAYPSEQDTDRSKNRDAEVPKPNNSKYYSSLEKEQAEDRMIQGKQHVDGFVYSDKIPMDEELQKFTFQQCQKNGISYELVLAVMWRESGFDTSAININTNGTQDSGIMQINDVNRSWLSSEHGITDLMDPKQNIIAGTTILGDFVGRLGEQNALLAYQYGEGGMQRKLKQGVTTSLHVEQLHAQREYFKVLLKEAAAEAAVAA